MAMKKVKAQVGEGGVGNDFSKLPEGCIATIVSLTTPRDACRLSLLSANFKSACDSDVVWSAFLPSDYESILASASSGGCRSPPPHRHSSLKNLFFSLCDDPVFIGDGKMSFSLDRRSGKKCIMLSATTLSIKWGETPRSWSWTPSSDSRFGYVAELSNAGWFEIRSKVSSRFLSPGTHYVAYLVFKSTPSARGFEIQTVEVGAGFDSDEGGSQDRGDHHHPCSLTGLDTVHRHYTRLRRSGRAAGFYLICREFTGLTPEAVDDAMGPQLPILRAAHDGEFPTERPDGWLESELGEFFVEGGENEKVHMSALETKGEYWKGGLIVEGIEIRPKKRKGSGG